MLWEFRPRRGLSTWWTMTYLRQTETVQSDTREVCCHRLLRPETRECLGLLDYFTSRPRPVYYPVGVASPGYTVTRPASGGSRYGQPSLLASSGSLSPSTSSATLSVSPWVTVPDTGLSGSRYSVNSPYTFLNSPPLHIRYGQPSLLASSGSLTSNTKTASLSITPGQGSVSGSRYEDN